MFKGKTEQEIKEIKDKAASTRRLKSIGNQLKKHKTLNAAVRAHCKSCIYDPADCGNWLQQVKNCTVKNCDLYEWRPLSESGNNVA